MISRMLMPPEPVSKSETSVIYLPLKSTTFLNFLSNMGYMSVKDENFPRAQGVLRVKYMVGFGSILACEVPSPGVSVFVFTGFAFSKTLGTVQMHLLRH